MTSPTADPGPARALSSLQDLPNELLQTIASLLIPDPPATTRFSLRPVLSWEFRDADAQWAAWKSRHRDLQALACTSQRMTAIAAAHQYHTIVVHSGVGLVRLFRHLVDRPDARSCIRSLSCLVNLLDSGVVSDARRELALLIGDGFRVPPELLSRPATAAEGAPARPAPVPSPDNSIALALFNFVVGYADRLDDLLMAHPDQSRPVVHPALIDLLFDIPGLSTAKVTAHPREPLLFPAKASMQRLASLRLYCNREGSGRDDTFSQVFARYVVSILPELPGLNTLEFCCDSATAWSRLLRAPAYPALLNIRHVRLYGSRIREPELVALCGACTGLETLVVHFEDKCDDEFDRPRLPGGRTLNDALLGLADSLRHLELVTVSDGHYLTRGRERPRKPENHRLTCFPALHNLRNLSVDYRGLFGTLGALEYEDGEALPGLLPASLRNFTLVCEWGADKDFKQSYLADLEVMLDGVKLLCCSGRQKLSSITLMMHSWPETSKYRSKYRRNMVQVKATCDGAGVRFRAPELPPAYRDEDEAGELDGDGDGDEEDEDGDNEGEYEEEEEDSEYYFSGDDEADPERDANRPASFEEFLQLLGDDHGHDVDELYHAYYYEDRWDEYLF